MLAQPPLWGQTSGQLARRLSHSKEWLYGVPDRPWLSVSTSSPAQAPLS